MNTYFMAYTQYGDTAKNHGHRVWSTDEQDLSKVLNQKLSDVAGTLNAPVGSVIATAFNKLQ